MDGEGCYRCCIAHIAMTPACETLHRADNQIGIKRLSQFRSACVQTCHHQRQLASDQFFLEITLDVLLLLDTKQSTKLQVVMHPSALARA
eukprot:1004833-Amphidinium_carterae.2